jgi:hypothetical protein
LDAVRRGFAAILSSKFAMTSPPPRSSTSSPRSVEILSGGKRFSLCDVTFVDLGGGQWQIEFSMAAQRDTITLIDIVRAGGGALMLSIDGGPVVGAHTRLRPLYQTILSQPLRFEFAWP